MVPLGAGTTKASKAPAVIFVSSMQRSEHVFGVRGEIGDRHLASGEPADLAVVLVRAERLIDVVQPSDDFDAVRRALGVGGRMSMLTAMPMTCSTWLHAGGGSAHASGTCQRVPGRARPGVTPRTPRWCRSRPRPCRSCALWAASASLRRVGQRAGVDPLALAIAGGVLDDGDLADGAVGRSAPALAPDRIECRRRRRRRPARCSPRTPQWMSGRQSWQSWQRWSTSSPTALVLMGAGRAAREPAVACDSLIPANR